MYCNWSQFKTNQSKTWCIAAQFHGLHHSAKPAVLSTFLLANFIFLPVKYSYFIITQISMMERDMYNYLSSFALFQGWLVETGGGLVGFTTLDHIFNSTQCVSITRASSHSLFTQYNRDYGKSHTKSNNRTTSLHRKILFSCFLHDHDVSVCLSWLVECILKRPFIWTYQTNAVCLRGLLVERMIVYFN